MLNSGQIRQDDVLAYNQLVKQCWRHLQLFVYCPFQGCERLSECARVDIQHVCRLALCQILLPLLTAMGVHGAMFRAAAALGCNVGTVWFLSLVVLLW
jgi:hypothetical protein